MKKYKEWKDFKPSFKRGIFLTQANGFRINFKLVSMLLPKSKKKKYKGKKQIVYELPIYLKLVAVSDKDVAGHLKTTNLDKFSRIVGMSCNTNQVYILQLSESAFNQLGMFIQSNLITKKDILTYERYGEGFSTSYKFEVLKITEKKKL